MKIRTTIPKNNKYYIRQVTGGLNGAVSGEPTISGANVLANCVGYANGRFNEIINDPDLKGIVKPFKYQLVCNAENFIESAKRQGLKISSKPTVGGIMVWQKGSTLGGGDGAGHVAIVEQIYEDGSIYTSESGWGSREWAFKNLRRNNSNGRWGQNSLYKFRGCIINPSIKNGKPVPTPKLTVDGIGGTATIMRMQEFFKVAVIDGVISGQNKNLAKYYPSIREVEYGKGGSATIKVLQKWLGITADGIIGQNTTKTWQRKLNSLGYPVGVVDGIFGKNSMKAWQECLNNDCKKKSNPTPSPTPSKKKYKVIDVSEFQDNINWTKAKADGVQGAIIRCGFRGATSGKLQTDAMFLNHIKGAHKAGIPVGIYMFTEAINSKEGKEEADYAIKLWQTAGVPISFPIAIDTEAVNIKDERAKNLTKAQRTNAIKGFCERIKEKGYTPIIYASTSWMNSKLDMSKLPYDVWVAQYNDVCEYKGKYVMWQYTSMGRVAGVSGNVDLNHCYIAPKSVDPPKAPTLIDKEMDACKVQADWMKNYTYKWQAKPTVEKSKKYGTCVTYVACVLQRIGVLKPGESIWHTKVGKVDFSNDKIASSYPSGTLKSLKSKLKRGDIVMAGDKASTEAGGNSHIFILTGEWDAKGNPYIWDNHSAERVKKGLNGKHTYSGAKNVIAVVRLK